MLGKDGSRLGADVHGEALLKDLTLQTGDVLYIPRGFAHEAATSDSPSLHLTLTVPSHDFTYGGMIVSAVKAALEKEVRCKCEDASLEGVSQGGDSLRGVSQGFPLLSAAVTRCCCRAPPPCRDRRTALHCAPLTGRSRRRIAAHWRCRAAPTPHRSRLRTTVTAPHPPPDPPLRLRCARVLAHAERRGRERARERGSSLTAAVRRCRRAAPSQRKPCARRCRGRGRALAMQTLAAPRRAKEQVQAAPRPRSPTAAGKRRWRWRREGGSWGSCLRPRRRQPARRLAQRLTSPCPTTPWLRRRLASKDCCRTQCSACWARWAARAAPSAASAGAWSGECASPHAGACEPSLLGACGQRAAAHRRPTTTPAAAKAATAATAATAAKATKAAPHCISRVLACFGSLPFPSLPFPSLPFPSPPFPALPLAPWVRGELRPSHTDGAAPVTH